MYYRFPDGCFVEAETFAEAVKRRIEDIMAHEEDPEQWHRCTCLGLSHRLDCPENKNDWGDEVPY